MCIRDRRTNALRLHPHWTEQFAESRTNKDGSVDNFYLEHLDIRWSNLCNYKCRFCSLASSNTWLQDQHNLKHIPGYNKNFDKFNPKTGIAEYDMDWEDLKKHLPYLNFTIRIMYVYLLLEIIFLLLKKKEEHLNLQITIQIMKQKKIYLNS